MINRLFQSFFISKLNSLISEKQEAAILHDIEIINFKRMKLLLNILLTIEILFMGFNDIPNLRNSGINTTWSDKRYFVLHLLLSIVAFAGIIIIKILIKNDKGELKKAYKVVVSGLTMIMLVFISIISGLDQIKIGNGSSVFIANLLVCSAIIMIRFPMDLIVYSVPFSAFIGGLLFFQKDAVVLTSSIINGTIFFIAAIFISKTVYDSQFNLLSKNIILEELNHRLDYISNYDPLTGLSNRRNFQIQAKQKMEHMNQNGKDAVLVLADIDHFKNVNDKFGHPVGDLVLKEVSNILLENIKDTDLVSRWGGEEFLILLFKTSTHEAYILASKIRVAIENKSIIIDEFKINITASFGVAVLKGNFSNSFDACYNLADKALYEAKNQGRNQVVVDAFTKDE